MLLLRATVACAGASVLILEILGSRLLAPVFGSTLYVWSSLIAVTLLSLAVGYAAGGWLADRAEPLAALHRLTVLAGWLILPIPLVRSAVLAGTVRLGLDLGALASAFVLLAPALFLLGCIAPLAAKAAVAGMGELGRRVGGLYALSTVGSLAGALATGFILIPYMGVRKVLLVAAALLFLPATAFWLLVPRIPGRRLWRMLSLAGLVACAAGALTRISYPVDRGGGFVLLNRTDSPYAEIKVVQRGRVRVMLLDGTLQTGVDMMEHASLFGYAAAAEGLIFAAHPRARRMLVIGLGGGILAERLASAGAEVDAVEIDPHIAAAARWFFIGNSPVRIVVEDGRTYLSRIPPGSYDAIALDAYAGGTPPAHLFTAEFYRLVRRALAPDGVGLANIISYRSGPRSALARSAGRTLAQVFPWVRGWGVEETENPTNVLYLFGERPRRISRLAFRGQLGAVAESVRGMLNRPVDPQGPDTVVFTDDFNPLERMSLDVHHRMRSHLLELFPRWILLE